MAAFVVYSGNLQEEEAGSELSVRAPRGVGESNGCVRSGVTVSSFFNFVQGAPKELPFQGGSEAVDAIAPPLEAQLSVERACRRSVRSNP